MYRLKNLELQPFSRAVEFKQETAESPYPGCCEGTSMLTQIFSNYESRVKFELRGVDKHGASRLGRHGGPNV